MVLTVLHCEFETIRNSDSSSEFLNRRFRDELGLSTKKQLQGRLSAMHL
ncbi:rCG25786 [Rattus norvegicus]|uniref:RCG25786 n=1 Tax=Rattus norvegicus TaxID=10116 RepID=A6I3J7_RAT|nr:rCG25786 [Rattus norvegicus]